MRRIAATIVLVVAAIAFGPSPAWAGSPIPPPKISQIFAGGGESVDGYLNDFVELKNVNASPFSLTGYSLQYTTQTGTAWEVTALSGSIPANGYWLIALGSNGAEGSDLPTADAAGTFNLLGAGGKLALRTAATALTDACPNFTTNAIVDFVGWGMPDCQEGSAPADALPGASWSLSRADGGCTDTNQNGADFNTGSPPTARNSAVTYSCANDAPVLTPIGPKAGDEGEELRFVVEALDPDGDQVTFTAANLPPGATFNGLALEWTPTCSQAGTYPGVYFEAHDPENLSDSEDITITVNEACEVVDTTTTLTVAKKGKKKLLASGAVAPPQPNGEVKVTLFRKRRGAFKHKAEDTAQLTGGSGYEARFKRPRKGKCRVVSEFAGDENAQPSRATETFRCRKP